MKFFLEMRSNAKQKKFLTRAPKEFFTKAQAIGSKT